MRTGQVVEAAAGVFLAGGTDVNWVIVRDGADVTLIDSGWRGDLARLQASLASIGSRPEDVQAILLTHAHIDHMGALAHFHDRFGVPVYMDGAEVAHARRDYLEQAGPAAVITNLLRPGVLPWIARVARAGALKRLSFAHGVAAAPGVALDLPGRPTPVSTHGHTSGHSAYYLPDFGAVCTGDGLVTGHPTSGVDGPQVLGPMFNHGDPVPALDALEGLDADLVLPGHGNLHRGPIADAVSQARAR